MPDPREEDDIFESAVEPESQDPGPSDTEVVVPDSAADQLVSSAISSMQREQGGPANQRFLPAQRRDQLPARQTPPGPGQQQPGNQNLPPELQGVIGELREERRARQALERELREMRNPRQPETPFSQRVFEDPETSIDGRVRQHIDPIAQHLQTMQTDFDMKLARATYGADVFDEAYDAWFRQVGDPNRPDPQNYWAVMNAPSPGEAVVAWYQNKPENLRERLRNEIMQELGMEAPPPARSNGKANGHGNGGSRPRDPETGHFTPRHEVRLPTATGRMGHTSREAAFSPEDGSDEAIFDFGRAKPERR